MFPPTEKTDPFGRKLHPDIDIVKVRIEDVFRDRRSTLLVLPAISREALLIGQRLYGCCIAGGAPLALYTGDVHKIKDWDLFFHDHPAMSNAVTELNRFGFTYVNSTNWSATYKKSGVVVQIVNWRLYRSIEEVFKSFDFSVCCFAVDGPNLVFTKQAAKDVEKGELNFLHTDDLIMCLKRIARYGQKGFMPSTECIKEIIKKAGGVDVDVIEDNGGCS